MPDPLAPADPGLLSSILDTARLPGFAIRNLLKGNLEGVGRNAVDLLGRAADAFVPGDWVSDISRKEDRPEFKDVVDLGGDNLGTDILNFAGDVATDPVSYIPGAAFAKAGSLAKAGLGKVVSKLPEVIQTPLREGAATIGRNVRSVAGEQRVSPETASALLGKQAASDLVSRTGSEATVNALAGLSDKELNALGQAGHNLTLDPITGRPAAVIDPTGIANFDQRLQQLMNQDPSLDPQRLLAAAPKMKDVLRNQWESGLEPASSPGGGIFFKDQTPGATGQGVEDYFPKQFSGLKENEIDQTTGLPKNLPGQVPDLAGSPAPAKQRNDWQPQDILNYLTQNPKVNLEFNAAKAMSARAAAQAELAGRAQVGQSLFDMAKSGQVQVAPHIQAMVAKDFKYADPDMKSAANEIAKQMPAEEATVLLNALNGLAPRGAFTNALAKVNTYFKGPAVFGAIIPKFGSITRNLTGGLFQQMANAEARGDTGRAAAQLVPNWLKSVDDGVEKLFGKRIGPNEFAEVDKAFKLAGGDPRKVSQFISDPMMKEATERGILGNNFVDTEGLIKTAGQGGWKAWGKNLLDYPAAMFKGAEQRMRYGLYKALRSKGKSADEATRIVSDTFYDYSHSSAGNRTMRDIIPFGQFAAKAIPQQAKFLAEKPLALSALANLSGGSAGNPIYPWMQGKPNIPIGRDEQGNQQYIASLGLPVESIGMLPNPSANLLEMGRQAEQNIVGATQPLLKAAYSAVSGRDPYFGSQYGAYGKLPIVGEAGAPGRILNQLLGTGLPGATQAAGVLGTAGKLTDPRTSAGETIANLLTGAKITSVDESRALQQLLQEAAKRDPSVSQYTTLYSKDPTDSTQELLDSLKAARAQIRAKKKLQASVN